MKPKELLAKTQKRLAKEIEGRQKVVSVLTVMAEFHPTLEIESAHQSGVFSDVVLNLRVGTPQELESLEGELPGISLVLAQDGNPVTSTFVPGSAISDKRYEDWAKTRIMPTLFTVCFPPNKTSVKAEWFTVVGCYVAKVNVTVERHGFELTYRKSEDTKKKIWVYGTPRYMDGYDPVVWWGEGSGPRDRTYYRLAAHGWDG